MKIDKTSKVALLFLLAMFLLMFTSWRQNPIEIGLAVVFTVWVLTYAAPSNPNPPKEKRKDTSKWRH